jgi:hypothetical protein
MSHPISLEEPFFEDDDLDNIEYICQEECE